MEIDGLPVSGNPNLSPEQNERLIQSHLEHAKIWGPQLVAWVGNASYYCDRLAQSGEQASPADAAVFWLRIYGVLHEIREDFQKKVHIDDENWAGVKRPRVAQRLRDQQGAILATIAKAMTLLSDDELLYLKYRRDNEAHVWQDAYRLSLKDKKNKKGFRETCRAFGRDWQIDNLDLRVTQLLRKYHLDEQAIAVDFARRLAPVIEELWIEAKRYCGA